VQVDGTVTDKRGSPVSDLTKEEFQLFVDGQLKPITTFYYVPPASGATTASAKNKDTNGQSKPGPPPTHTRLREDQVRRIIVLVVANVSADALRDVKKAMNRFVDEQMQPGDLVSVIRPAEGAGVLQQFTADKRLLHLAINGVRWNPLGNVGISAVPDADSTGESKDDDAAAATRREKSFYEDVVSSSWLRSFDLIVRGLQDLPGRKSVILFSNGFQLFGQDTQNRRVMEEVRTITDRRYEDWLPFTP
jgi:VWFA-related protein